MMPCKNAMIFKYRTKRGHYKSCILHKNPACIYASFVIKGLSRFLIYRFNNSDHFFFKKEENIKTSNNFLTASVLFCNESNWKNLNTFIILSCHSVKSMIIYFIFLRIKKRTKIRKRSRYYLQFATKMGKKRMSEILPALLEQLPNEIFFETTHFSAYLLFFTALPMIKNLLI